MFVSSDSRSHTAASRNCRPPKFRVVSRKKRKRKRSSQSSSRIRSQSNPPSPALECVVDANEANSSIDLMDAGGVRPPSEGVGNSELSSCVFDLGDDFFEDANTYDHQQEHRQVVRHRCIVDLVPKKSIDPDLTMIKQDSEDDEVSPNSSFRNESESRSHLSFSSSDRLSLDEASSSLRGALSEIPSPSLKRGCPSSSTTAAQPRSRPPRRPRPESARPSKWIRHGGGPTATVSVSSKLPKRKCFRKRKKVRMRRRGRGRARVKKERTRKAFQKKKDPKKKVRTRSRRGRRRRARRKGRRKTLAGPSRDPDVLLSCIDLLRRENTELEYQLHSRRVLLEEMAHEIRESMTPAGEDDDDDDDGAPETDMENCPKNEVVGGGRCCRRRGAAAVGSGLDFELFSKFDFDQFLEVSPSPSAVSVSGDEKDDENVTSSDDDEEI